MSDPDGLRRVALVAGTGRYDFADEWKELDEMKKALRLIVGSLKPMEYVPVGRNSYARDPTTGELTRLLTSTPPDADVVVAYYAGHGHVDGLHYLVARNSTRKAPKYIYGSALETRTLPRLLEMREPSGDRRKPQPHVLIIVDTCFAGAAAPEIVGDALREFADPKRTWVIVSARRVDYAQQAAFPAALREALAVSTAGPGQRYVSPDIVVTEVNKRLPARQKACIVPPAAGYETIPPFFPNPEFEDVPSSLTVAGQKRWMSRATGADVGSAAGYYLAGTDGRTAAAKELAGWIRDPDRGPTAIVTGGPGSGKSALLALPLLLDRRVYRENLLAATRGRRIVNAAAQLLAPDAATLTAIRGRGLNADQIAGVIARSLGREARTTADLFTTLDRVPATNAPVVVLDGLDEAEQPAMVLDDLMSPLATERGMRVVIGAGRRLAAAVPNPSLVVDLDAYPYSDVEALAEYVDDLLVAAEEPGVRTPYQRIGAPQREAIAHAISEQADGSFLAGQLAAFALRTRTRAVNTRQQGWQQDLPTDAVASFEADLARLGERAPVAQDLLTALAWAKGPGLPWENIWVPVANAIRTTRRQPSPEELTDANVRWLRDNLGSYFVEDLTPSGRSVFRLCNESLAATLRDAVRTDAPKSHAQTTHGRITNALLATVPSDDAGVRLWTLAHPYIRSYLAPHAAAASTQRLTELLTEQPQYLVTADPTTIGPLLLGNQPSRLRELAAVYQTAAHRLGSDLRWNAAYLQEAAVAVGDKQLADAFPRVAEPAFTTVIAERLVERESDPAEVVTPDARDIPPVSGLAVARNRAGASLLVSAGLGGIQAWDPASRQAIRLGRDETPAPVSAVTALQLPTGSCLLAYGIAATGRIGLVDIESGGSTECLLEGHPSRVTALAAVPARNGQVFLASAGEDGTVRLWDTSSTPPASSESPSTREQHQPPTLHTGAGAVHSLAVIPLRDGGSVLVGGCHDGTVRLWDTAERKEIRAVSAHSGPVRALAVVSSPDGRVIIASGGDDGRVRLWGHECEDVAADPLHAHEGPVRALAPLVSPTGSQLLASGGDDGNVRLWDAVDWTHTADAGRRGPVRAIVSWTAGLLAIGSLEGLTVLTPPSIQEPGASSV